MSEFSPEDSLHLLPGFCGKRKEQVSERVGKDSLEFLSLVSCSSPYFASLLLVLNVKMFGFALVTFSTA